MQDRKRPRAALLRGRLGRNTLGANAGEGCRPGRSRRPRRFRGAPPRGGRRAPWARPDAGRGHVRVCACDRRRRARAARGLAAGRRPRHHRHARLRRLQLAHAARRPVLLREQSHRRAHLQPRPDALLATRAGRTRRSPRLLRAHDGRLQRGLRAWRGRARSPPRRRMADGRRGRGHRPDVPLDRRQQLL